MPEKWALRKKDEIYDLKCQDFSTSYPNKQSTRFES